MTALSKDHLKSVSDQELVRRIQAGEIDLFDELARRYRHLLESTAFRILRNRADAKEVAQDASFKCFRYLKDLRETDRFKCWLLQICTNEALRRLRKEKLSNHSPLEECEIDADGNEASPREFVDEGPIPSTVLERKELQKLVNNALGKLTECQRQVLELRDLQHLSVAETAQKLGLTECAVNTRLHRARCEMQRLIAPKLNKTPYASHKPMRSKLRKDPSENV